MNSSFNSKNPPSRNSPANNASFSQRGSNFPSQLSNYPQNGNPAFNNSFSHAYNYPQHQQFPPNRLDKESTKARNNWNHQQNFSQEFSPKDFHNSFNNSFASQADRGVPEVGRFGGARKKMRQQCDSSFSSNTKSNTSSSLKVKQPTVKQQSSNQFYFPIHTETTTYVECPFNSNHIMQPNRLITHINKCKLKSENAKYFSVCPYDPCHYFYTTEIAAHILVCDKRSLFVVSDSWDEEFLNNSTTSSIPNSNDTELIETASKAPTSKFQNEDKRIFEEFLIDP